MRFPSIIVLTAVVSVQSACSRGRPASANADLRSRALLGSNLLLVTIDTLRADRVGAYGAGHLTPAIDRLAAQGIRFSWARSHVPLTLPAHASILTGLVPATHGLHNNGAAALEPHIPTLAAPARCRLSDRRVHRAFVLDARFGLNRGFDVYDDRVGSNTGPITFAFTERSADQVTRVAGDWVLAGAPSPIEPAASSPRSLVLLDPPVRSARPVPGARAARAESLRQRGRVHRRANRRAVRSSARRRPARSDDRRAAGGPRRVARRSRGSDTWFVCVRRDAPHSDDCRRSSHSSPGRRRARLAGRRVADTPGLARRSAAADAGRSLAARADSRRGRRRSPDLLRSARRVPDPRLGAADRGDRPRLEVHRSAGTRVVRSRPRPGRAAQSGGPQPRAGVRTAPRSRPLESAVHGLHARSHGPGRSRRRGAAAGARLHGKSSASGCQAGVRGQRRPERLLNLDRQYEQALTLTGERRYGEAAALLRMLIAARPDFLVAYTNLASVLIESGRPREAVMVLAEASSRGMATVEVRARLGAAYLASGDPARASAVLEPLATAGEGGLDVLNTRAIALSQLGRRDEARRLFEQVLQRSPGSATTWNNLGLLEMAARRPREAARAFENAVSADPGFLPAWQALGAARAQSNPRGAIDAWRKAIALAPDDYDVLFNLAVLLHQQRRDEEARPYVERFVRDAPPARYASDIATLRALLAK